MEKTRSYLPLILSIIFGIFLLVGSFFLSRLKIDFSRFTSLGYVGVFLATLLGSATLFFPVPNIATVFAAGRLFNPLGVGLAGGFGSAIGEMTGYYVGFGGGLSIKFPDLRAKIIHWINRYGWFTIFLLAFIPNPFFDIAGLWSGITHYPVSKFFLATLCGKTLRSLVLAYLSSVVR